MCGGGGVSHNFGLKVVDTQLLVNPMSCQFGFETESAYEFIIEVPPFRKKGKRNEHRETRGYSKLPDLQLRYKTPYQRFKNEITLN